MRLAQQWASLPYGALCGRRIRRPADRAANWDGLRGISRRPVVIQIDFRFCGATRASWAIGDVRRGSQRVRERVAAWRWAISAVRWAAVGLGRCRIFCSWRRIPAARGPTSRADLRYRAGFGRPRGGGRWVGGGGVEWRDASSSRRPRPATLRPRRNGNKRGALARPRGLGRRLPAIRVIGAVRGTPP